MATGQILRDATGQLLRDADGKLKLWAPSVWHDTYAKSWDVLDTPGGAETMQVLWNWSTLSRTRMFIRPPNTSGGGTLWLYVTYLYSGWSVGVNVHEITADWDEATCCWTNQPSVGSLLISNQRILSSGWSSFALPASTYGYRFSEVQSTSDKREALIASSEHSDSSKRPYWA